MRRRRGPGVVAVTGAARGLGRLLVEQLATRRDLDGVIGIDAEPARLDGVTWRSADVRDPVLRERLAGVSTLVHLATTYDAGVDVDARRALNVTGTAAVLEAARAAGVVRVVLTTSAAVYEAVPGGPLPLPEDAPLRVESDTGLLGDHLEVERLGAEAARAGLAVTVLRPATLVGGRLGRAYDGAVLRQLAAPRLLAVRGAEPLWQLCHVDDLVCALELAATGQVHGGLSVGCDGWLPQSTVERIAGKRRVELPLGVAMGTAERLHQLGATSASPRELDHLVAPVVVGSEALRAAGWAATWTNEAALRAHLADRDADGGHGHAGAYTAAGATVALLGTAALVRRARRRRRGI